MSKSHWLVCVALAAGLFTSTPAWAVMAGSATGTPADSPSNRVIANSDTSNPFAGVGTIDCLPIGHGTAIPISRWHILTAGHIVDGVGSNANGVVSVDPSEITFNLNYGTSYSSIHTGSSVALNDDFAGAYHSTYNPDGEVNDDLAIVTLSTPIPEGVPVYNLWTSVINTGTTLNLVGYGQSGYGDVGYSVGFSWTTKRWGQNALDVRIVDDGDDGIPQTRYEVWRADFDGPTGNGTYGGSTLGNDIETSLGVGDSGGPAFYYSGGQYYLAGVNTFVFNTGEGNVPVFGSGLGGVLIHPYISWINTVLSEPIEALGDVNGDLFVNSDDLVRILTYWGETDGIREHGDLNEDGLIGADDYVEVLTYWGTMWPAGPAEPVSEFSSIPEPTTLCLLALGIAGMLIRGRNK